MEAICLAPIDTIKTRLQLDKAKQYNGIAHCGQTIMRTEGVRALWKGVVPFSTHLTFKYALRCPPTPSIKTYYVTRTAN
jgi:solute carrier family 25 (mitochondrial citrate transporter), member 1